MPLGAGGSCGAARAEGCLAVREPVAGALLAVQGPAAPGAGAEARTGLALAEAEVRLRPRGPAAEAYARQLSSYPASLRPFLEVQYHRVRFERGDVPRGGFPGADSSFWVMSVGARLFLGGGPMRMGSYGVLDPMTMMGQMMPD